MQEGEPTDDGAERGIGESSGEGISAHVGDVLPEAATGCETGRHRVVGDVDFDSAVKRAGAITPDPGGVGPMTIGCLLLNTLNAAIRTTPDAGDALSPFQR